MRVTLTNQGAQPVRFLKWHTPLDPLLCDCFVVKSGGKVVPYDGPLVKRAAPTSKDYVTLAPGKSISAEVSLSDAYNTTKTGKYQILLKPLPDVRAGGARLSLAAAAKPMKLSTPAKAAFQIVAGKGVPHRTLGAQARFAQPTQLKRPTSKKVGLGAKKKAALTALAPVVKGGTAAEKAAARQAHLDGYNLCVAALAGLANDAKYREWFGTHTTARFNKAKAVYTKVKNRMDSTTFTYDLTGTGCRSRVFAYTYHGSTTIWYCDAFWSAPATGTDSKAGTCLHEHTHSDALTDDIAYGQVNCRNLATSNPDNAVNNADSFEYYAGG